MSTEKQRTLIGVLFTGFLVLTMGIVLYVSLPVVHPLLGPIPPCDTPPQSYDLVETIQAGPLLLNATAYSTGVIPHQGPITFLLSLMINITNTGNTSVGNFQSIKMSIYTTDSILFYTFSLRPDWNATILAGETVVLNYMNEPTRIETPVRPWEVYGRVLVTFDINESAIVTTPLIQNISAVE